MVGLLFTLNLRHWGLICTGVSQRRSGEDLKAEQSGHRAAREHRTRDEARAGASRARAHAQVYFKINYIVKYFSSK